MAPSLRKTVPSSSVTSSTTISTRNSSVKSKTQKSQRELKPALASRCTGFGRVTKAKGTGLKVKFSDVQKGAFEQWCGENEKVEIEVKPETKEDVLWLSEQKEQDIVSVSRLLAKRKRGDISDCESESEFEAKSERLCSSFREQKKQRVHSYIQLPSPPASRDGTDSDDVSPLKDGFLSDQRNHRIVSASPASFEVPQPLLDLISMHTAFLKALSLHYAHNGAASPAELGALMDSMTKLWKKQAVRKDAVQKMLAIYEIAAEPTLLSMRQIDQKHCPFKIVTSGLGSNVRTNLEYVGQPLYSEASLQTAYPDMVHKLFRSNPSMDNNLELPLLTISLGMQTVLHRAKAASTRAEILGLSAAAQARSTPDFSKLSISDSLEHTPAAVKSRTLSLFDRVRAKGLTSASNTAPTSEQVARRHAIGRIGEVVEFLRMKQQQRVSTQFQGSIYDSPGKIRGSGKVSFSLGAIVRDIRQSVSVPIGEEEVRICLTILSRELPGDWCRMIELGTVVSVTLTGTGMSGAVAKRLLEVKG